MANRGSQVNSYKTARSTRMYEEIKKTRDENYLTCLVTAMYNSAEKKESYSQSYLKLQQLDDNNNLW